MSSSTTSSCIRNDTNGACRDQAPKARNHLKSTCDFCVMSKVKCDKQWPQCSRCIRYAVECHYSATRRSGRVRELYTTSVLSRPSAKIATPNSQWNQQSESELCTSRPEASRSQNQIGDVPGSSDYAMLLDLFGRKANATTDEQVLSTQSIPNNNEINHHGQPSSSMALLSPESQGDFFHILSGQLAADRAKSENINDMNMQYPPFNLDSTMEELAKDNLHGQQPSLNKADCMKRALATLESLHLPSSPCPRHGVDFQSPSSNAHGLDSTLKINRTAIETVLDILSCLCASNRNVLSNLVLIAHQVMDSYWNLLRQQLSIALSPTDNSFFGKRAYGRGQEVACLVLDVPMAIGGYFLDGEARKKVLEQVLRSEIEKMGGIINTLRSCCTDREATETPYRFGVESLQARQEISSKIH